MRSTLQVGLQKLRDLVLGSLSQDDDSQWAMDQSVAALSNPHTAVEAFFKNIVARFGRGWRPDTCPCLSPAAAAAVGSPQKPFASTDKEHVPSSSQYGRRSNSSQSQVGLDLAHESDEKRLSFSLEEASRYVYLSFVILSLLTGSLIWLVELGTASRLHTISFLKDLNTPTCLWALRFFCLHT
jgi:hypothetical protein